MSNIVKQEFAVEGMHCGGCVKSVTGAVARLSGIKKVDVSLEKKIATVEYDGSAIAPSAVVDAIEAAGFEAKVR